MSPAHANRGNSRYRYYISQALLQHRELDAGSISRIAANDIETAVWNTMEKLLSDPHQLLKFIGYENPDIRLIEHISNIFDAIKFYSDDRIISVIEKVVIEKELLLLFFSSVNLAALFGIKPIKKDNFLIKEPIKWQLNGKGYSLLINNRPISNKSKSEVALRKSVIKALEWNYGLLDGSINSLHQIELEENLNTSYVRRTLRLAYLNPNTLNIILNSISHAGISLELLRTKLLFKWSSYT